MKPFFQAFKRGWCDSLDRHGATGWDVVIGLSLWVFIIMVGVSMAWIVL